MLNKTNNQTHYGQGNQYINQSTTNNIFLTYGESNPNDSTNNPGVIALIFLIVSLTLGNLILGLVQEHKHTIILTQIIMLIIINSYVYWKSKNLKLLLTEMAPSVLSVITTLSSTQINLPLTYQSVLDKINANPDISSWEGVLNSFLNSAAIKYFELFSEYSPYTISLVAVYILIVILVIISPLFIAFNAIFKKSLKNYFAYVVTISYWCLFLALKMIQ
ncbi:TPA: hypothetical protein TUD09_001626 [Streptococcus equi subsp. zooepidemicus]|uniref:Uncharacterized protein n=1 Tax=Streptococcus equi subsp. ruminatorum CECT 5772 TaxID=1051981 RepID=A0A922NVC6_9STRE|nr:hypothetical protein [Streptococcus equi]KED04972.1 hypothetical protein CECT5772_02448 [Streptococcus equi subsp. ruminatorum CECT 5772]HEL0247353.1 hypothetical protein [Streptococcus equi subsp. zooepidemicus]HEL1024455.1 hypothetical protein [Streptococcus equi subsp. ruminatorum CECT 5772]